MSKKVIAILVIVLSLGAGIFFLTSGSDDSNTSTEAYTGSTNNTSASDSPAKVAESTELTLSEVAKHNSKSDCWTVIDGTVYDITSYIPRHEGGDNILSACGVDSTEFFNGNKAGQDGDSNRHSGSAKSQLSQFELGELKN